MGVCLRKWRLLRLKLKKHWMTVIWVSTCIVMFYIDYVKYKEEPQYYYLRQMLGVSMSISRGTAAVLNLSCCFLVVPMCRAVAAVFSTYFKIIMSHFHEGPQNTQPLTLPTLLTGQATQTAKSLHTMIAVTVLLSSALHTSAHIWNSMNFSRYYSMQYPEINVATHKGQSPLYFFMTTVPGITGMAMIIILSVLGISSTKWARHRNYNAFFYTHHLGIIFFLLLLIHPLGGVLKQQINLQGHIPGCQLYENPVVEEGSDVNPVVSDYISKNPQEAHYQSEANLEGNSSRASIKEFEDDAFEPFDGRSQDNEERRDWTKAYVRRKICEAPLFESICSKTWIWITIALSLWVIDSFVRWWRQRADVKIINVVHHPCDILQLTLYQSGFSCTPGQYVLVQCPSVSRFEWHPFTVTCPPSEHSNGTFTILIRTRGDWSRRVARLFYASSKSDQLQLCSLQSCASSSLYSSIVNHPSHKRYEFMHRSSQAEQENSKHDHYAYSPQKNLTLEANHNYMRQFKISRSSSYFTAYDDYGESHDPLHSTLSSNDNLEFSTGDCNRLSCSPPKLKENMPSFHSFSQNPQLSANSFLSKQTMKLLQCNKNSPQSQKKDISIKCDHSYPERREFSKLSYKNYSHVFTKTYEADKENCSTRNTPSHTRLCIDGPYRSPSEDMLQYSVIIGAAGGVGITPLAATLSYKLWNPVMWPRRIHMVWVVRDARLLLVIAPLLSSLLLHCWQANMEDSIEIRLHVTIPTTRHVLQDLFADDYPCLLPRIIQGRPHWKHLFQEWRQIYTREKVGIFTCGPPKMCRQVKRHCIQSVTKGANFNYHQESFS